MNKRQKLSLLVFSILGIMLFCSFFGCKSAKQVEVNMVKIKWFGHAMWSISNGEKNIIIDPFSDIGYPMPEGLTADIVIASHGHADHNNFNLIEEPYNKIDAVTVYEKDGINIETILTSHGEGRGDNLITIIKMNGLTMLHCGDLGVVPDEDIINHLQDIDILFVPTGGFYTIDAETASNFVKIIEPKIVFPMHYKLANPDLPIASIEDFKTFYPNLEKLQDDYISFSVDTLPEQQRVIQLDYE